MEIFRELSVHGRPDALDRLFSRIDSALSDGWSRDKEHENPLGGHDEWRVYSAPQRPDRQAASLFFVMNRDAGVAKVTNVVPTAIGSLTIRQYNQIVKEFHQRFLAPALDRSLNVELGSDTTSGRDILGEAAYKLLEKFSVLANKSTGSSHPLDQGRWFDFLYCMKDQDWRGGWMLLRILEEELEWSEETAHRLIRQYEFARDLLRHPNR